MQCEVIVLLLPQTRNPDVKISQQIDYNRIRNPHVREEKKSASLFPNPHWNAFKYNFTNFMWIDWDICSDFVLEGGIRSKFSLVLLQLQEFSSASLSDSPPTDRNRSIRKHKHKFRYTIVHLSNSVTN